MREKSAPDNHLIGYEKLLSLFRDIQSQCPKGVGLKKETKSSSTYILLQFKLGDKRVAKSCNCTFTEIGIIQSLEKALKVSEALSIFTSEIEFNEWYEETILGKNVIKNDLITFREAIQKVEDYFWSSFTTKRQPRDRNNASHQTSWNDAYGRHFKLLPLDNPINYPDIVRVIEQKPKGTKTYKMAVRAMRKLAQINHLSSINKELEKIDITQVKFKEDLQKFTIEDFLQIKEQILNVPPNDKRFHLDSRRAWMFVFSMQVVYGLRISEVFAVQNIDKIFTTKDGITIPALNDPNNEDMIAVIGAETLLGTTTKTGYRLSIPLIPPNCPNLIEILEIRTGKLPQVSLISDNPISKRHKYAKTARTNLLNWLKGTRFTQTHALRHLANLHGIMAGVPLEKRAMSLGHSPAMNDSTYKKRRTTETTLDILTSSNSQAIPLQSAIVVAKQLGCTDEKSIKLLAAIYNMPDNDISSFLQY